MTFTWATPKHRQYMADYRRRLLDFYQPHVVNPTGSFFWLDSQGGPIPEMGSLLWISARMIHCFSLASLEGRVGAREIAWYGVDFYLNGAGRDPQHGGWFAKLDMQGRGSGEKDLYGLAHLILASSSAKMAGIPGGAELLQEALKLLDDRFWREDFSVGVDAYSADFGLLSPYRGMNANMHLTEALLAAHDATGDPKHVERAKQIAWRLVGEQAMRGDHRLVEHYGEEWTPQPEYNSDQPAHPFKPYGATPGHWLEWAKLLMQLEAKDDEAWMLPAAQLLFNGAIEDGWLPGFGYTVDWSGRPVIATRFWWALAEGIGAAHLLALRTDERKYKDWYEEFWHFAHAYFEDPRNGMWFCELNNDLQPVEETWRGKPDLYHVYQAALMCETTLERGLTRTLLAR